MHELHISVGLPFKVGNNNKDEPPLSKFWKPYKLFSKISKILREDIVLLTLPTLKGRPNDTKNIKKLSERNRDK